MSSCKSWLKVWAAVLKQLSRFMFCHDLIMDRRTDWQTVWQLDGNTNLRLTNLPKLSVPYELSNPRFCCMQIYKFKNCVNSASIFYVEKALLRDQPTDRQTIWWTNGCLEEVVYSRLITYHYFNEKKAKNNSFLHFNQIHQIFHIKNDLISILSSNNSKHRSGRRGISFLSVFFLIFPKIMVIGFVFPRAFLLSFLQLNSSASNHNLLIVYCS